MRAFTTLVWLLAQTTLPSPAPPSPTPLLLPAPMTSSSPTPAAFPAASPPSAQALPTPPVLPPEAAPQILAVRVSDPVFHSGEVVSGTVITSTNVVSVEVRFAGRTAHIPPASPGVWEMAYRLPRIPFFLRGNYTAHIVAANSQGASTERDFTVAIR